LHDMQMQVLFTENSNSFACLAWEHGSNWPAEKSWAEPAAQGRVPYLLASKITLFANAEI
jgi:hypothetical protein